MKIFIIDAGHPCVRATPAPRPPFRHPAGNTQPGARPLSDEAVSASSAKVFPKRITLGLLMASAVGQTARELANRLELGGTDELRAAWLGRLLDWGLVESAGKTQTTRYFVSPMLLKGEGLDGQTTLKRVEPHRLRALIVEDLARYAGASSADVQRRTAPELAQRTIRCAQEELVEQGQVRFEGEKRWRRYWLINKGQSQ